MEVPDGSTVLEAINSSGTYISQLCKDPDMKPIGACRTCLVKIDGVNGYPASCSTPVNDGMEIWTETSDVRNTRSGVLELTVAMLMGDHQNNDSGKNIEKDYQELSTALKHHGIKNSRWSSRKRQKTDESNPVFDIAMRDCILCGRCVQACQDGHQFIGAIDFLGAGNLNSRIGTFGDQPLIESNCTTCGQCLSVCPTGAIRTKKVPEPTVKTVTTTCPYCGVGCGIQANMSSSDRIIEVMDDPENQSSLGMLCVKGRFGYNFVHHKDRLTHPLIRKNGKLRKVDWDTAFDFLSEKLWEYKGPQFGTLCSAKATNEDGYVQQKFARLLMNSNNIDHCTRLCHSPSVLAMLESLGSGATSNSYIDYEEAGCLLIIGSDANSNHPVAAARMRRAVIEKGAKLIVINPRRIEMCDYADLWLRPRPGTDVALLNGIAKVILDQNLANVDFITNRTENFDEWKEVIEKYSLEYVEKITGVPSSDIVKAAKYYAKPPFSGSCLIWGMGITQHTNGTANAHSLLNLSLVTGQLGIPGAGISPLRGQNNVQGCGDAGCLPDNFPGYQAIESDAYRKFQKAWGANKLPDKNGLVVTEMVKAIDAGEIKAMYVTGENPLLSEPDLAHTEETFKKLELLIVQDIFMHETAELADIVLPATSFAEKDGTFTNSERRVQRVKKLVKPVGESRPDWQIFSQLAHVMSDRYKLNLNDQFSYKNTSEIWDEMAKLTPMFKGINYDRLESEGGIQWPCPDINHPGTRYLYQDDFPRGSRAKFFPFEQGIAAQEMPNNKFPLILNTGRTLYHWHGGTITKRSDKLMARSSELEVSININDGSTYNIKNGDWVKVISRRGSLEARAIFDTKMEPGQIFVPFTKLKNSAANFLTNSALDESSKIPEYKVCAVRIRKIRK